VVGILHLSFVAKLSIWESNNIIDINTFGFSHQIMQLKPLANHIKDQVIVIYS
jgi:hypothetical protein